MKRILCLLFLILVGCSSKPAPEWIAAGSGQLESYKRHFLTGGQSAVTERHFQKALEEIKKSGDLELLGKVWLTRMALQVAVLEKIEEGEYGTVASAQRIPANHNFYLFLTSDPAAVDGTLLPRQYRSFLEAYRGGDVLQAGKEVAAMGEDPLSQLIAAGLSVRRLIESEAILQTAVRAAAENGWKRALLAWLEHSRLFYEKSGEIAKANAVQRRMDLIGK
jgi:hypothetical protein